jgi:type I restriction enzyme S subunit
MTGSAGQRRVPEAFLSDLPIPLIPLDEQRRVAQILDSVDTLRTRRRKALALFGDLAQSVFFDMFGDPRDNPRQFPVSTVAEIARQVTDGEHLTPKRESDGIKLLSARNVKDGRIDLSNVDHVGQAEFERIRKRCEPRRGDVLISCSGTIGRVAPVETDEPFALVRSVALIRPRTSIVTTEYLTSYLRTATLKALMLQRAKVSSQANLFQGPIRALPVMVPSLGLQLDFGERIKKLSEAKASHQAHLAGLDALFASLRHRAFHGELWDGLAV